MAKIPTHGSWNGGEHYVTCIGLKCSVLKVTHLPSKIMSCIIALPIYFHVFFYVPHVRRQPFPSRIYNSVLLPLQHFLSYPLRCL